MRYDAVTNMCFRPGDTNDDMKLTIHKMGHESSREM